MQKMQKIKFGLQFYEMIAKIEIFLKSILLLFFVSVVVYF